MEQYAAIGRTLWPYELRRLLFPNWRGEGVAAGNIDMALRKAAGLRDDAGKWVNASVRGHVRAK